MAQSPNMVEVNKLHMRYAGAEQEALKGIDLTISRGEFFGLLGPNSAGKTTLISLICGLFSYNKGNILVNGFNTLKQKADIQPILGLVPQDIALYQNLSVRENIDYFGRMHNLSGHQLKEAAKNLIYRLKLDGHADKRISRCSGGIKRRVNLAAGMIHEPEVLILDEPTVGVDAQSRNLIFEYLYELNQQKTTIIYTTHYLDEAESLCSRVSIIDGGLIVETGAPKELILKHKESKNLGDVFLSITGKALRE